MGPGVTLLVVGAILSFAVRGTVPGVDIHVVGLILMLAGAGVIAHARNGVRHEQVRTTVEEPADPQAPSHVVRDTVVDRDVR